MLLVKVALNETGPFMPAEVVQGGRAGGSGAISLEGRSVMLTLHITTPRASDVHARSWVALFFLSPYFFLSFYPPWFRSVSVSFALPSVLLSVL